MAFNFTVGDNARLTDEEFDTLRQFILDKLGIKLSDHKKSMLESRLRRRLRHHNFDSYAEYCEFLFSEKGEQDELITFFDVVTTNKTDFFREPEHFDYLVSTALPTLLQGGVGIKRPLRVWSCAASSGEEPFTLAMVLQDFADKHEGYDFTILGTDISTEVLDTARAAIYKLSKVAPVPEEMKKKYLLRSKKSDLDLVRIIPELRDKVTFERLNLMDDTYAMEESFDIIFCRNVLIYFNRDVQTSVLQKICRHIHPGKYLFVGHSENISALPLPLKSTKIAIYRKLP